MTTAAPSPVPPTAPPTERVRLAVAARAESDYLFSFWTAFGWTLLTFGIYRLGAGSARSARIYAPSLVPIALGYLLAHYFSLLVYQGQATAYLASDPLGDGSDLLGTASATIDYTIIGATGIWYVQVGALVAGHVCGLILAHDRAVAMYRSARQATRSQYWMLAVMVGFTSLGLWLLSAAA